MQNSNDLYITLELTHYNFGDSGGSTIFELNKLVIPVNVSGCHWAVICVTFREREIRVYDSSPMTVLRDGGRSYMDILWRYLTDEHREKKGYDISPTRDQWKFIPCESRNEYRVKQQASSNDCGVFSCLFMDLIMNNVDPLLLRHCIGEVTNVGRLVLWQAIWSNRPIFDVAMMQTSAKGPAYHSDECL